MDWNVFYKAIGIAENIIDPSYYHILNLDFKSCDQQKVQKALADKKRELRQSIPSPEFIGPILLFEKEVLEKAAEVLGDDQKRHEYNCQLVERQRFIENKNRKKQKLIDDVREAIAEAVDEKGCLGGVERYLLEEKLHLLEVQEHNIRQILERIPEPLNLPVFDQQRLLMFFAGAVQLSINESMLGAQEERNLMELAGRLGLDSMQARLIIDQQLAQLSAYREGTKCGEIILEKPIKFDEPAPQETIPHPKPKRQAKVPSPIPEDIENVIDEIHHITVEKVFQIVVPILAIIIFIMTVFFLNKMNQKRKSQPDSQSLVQVQVPDEPVEIPSEKENPKQLPQQIPIQPESEVDDIKPIPAARQVTEFESELDHYRLFGSDASTDELLADIAMLIMGNIQLISKFQGVGNWYGRDLDGLSSRTDNRINKVLQLGSQLNLEVGLEDMKEEVTLLRLDEFKRILYSQRYEDRAYAISRMASLNRPEAYEIALAVLEDTTIQNKSGEMINQLLAMLAQSRSSIVAHTLAEIMERAGRTTAFQIEIVLAAMTGIQPAQEGILPLRNTLQQRRDASQWWQSHLWNWQVAPADISVSAETYSFEQTVLLSAIIADLARQAADMLGEANLGDDEIFAQRLRFKYGFDSDRIEQLKHSPAVGTDFWIEAMDSFVRLDDKTTVKADAVLLDRKVLLLAVEDDLHRTIVNMASMIDYLEILIEHMDTNGQYIQLVNELRGRYQNTGEYHEGLLLRLRDECFYGALYWDLLLQMKKEIQS